MKKVKVSELPVSESLYGLFTIGVDANNRSVKVPLEFIEKSLDDMQTQIGVIDNDLSKILEG